MCVWCVCVRERESIQCVYDEWLHHVWMGRVIAHCVYREWLHNVFMMRERERERERERDEWLHNVFMMKEKERECVCERERWVITQCVYEVCVCARGIWWVITHCVYEECLHNVTIVYHEWLYNVCMRSGCTMCVWLEREKEGEREREREMGDYTLCEWRERVCGRDMMRDDTMCVWGVLTQCV